MFRKAATVLSIILGLTYSCFGQRMEEQSGTANPFISGIRSASNDFPGAFPVLSAAEPDGSLVVASGDFHNSDITIIVDKGRLDALKPKVMDLLVRLRLPKTFVRVRRGRAVGSFDLEFNAYIVQKGNHSESTIPLGAVVDIVKGWNLPQPMGVAIRGSKRWSVRYRGETIETMKLLWPKDVSSGDLVEVSADRHWYGLVTAIFLACVMSSAVGFTLWITIKGPKKSVPALRAKPKTLVEAQAQYDSKNVKKSNKAVAMLPVLMVSFMFVMQFGMQDAMSWIPQGASNYMPLVLIPMFGIAMIMMFLRRFRKTHEPRPELDRVQRILGFVFIPGILLIGILFTQQYAPRIFYAIPLPVFRSIIGIIAASPIVIFVVYSLTAGKKSTEKLSPGDVDYDAAVELAKKLNVKFRQVIVQKDTKTTNAFARLDGTVVLTRGSRERLTAQDRRCIIAHELGHLRGRHVPWLILLSLCFWGGCFGLELWISNSKLPIAVIDASRLLTSPVIFLPALFIVRSPFQRKAEFAADKFALESIGNFTDVAVALAKVHLQNASPHTYTKFHESIASHPSLVKRLNALRETAIQMGLPVPENEVQKIIETLSIEGPDSTT